MYKLTPKYGIYKQIEYRDEVFKKIKERYHRSNRLTVVTLGGRFCLINPNSIENQILRHFKNARIIIVEQNKMSVKVLNKSLTILNRYGRKDKNRVSIFDKSIRKLFKCEDQTFDVVVADFYSSFNKNRIDECKFLFGRKLLNPNSQIFITMSESRRVKTRPIVKYVKSKSEYKDYKHGAMKIIESIIDKNDSELESPIESWSYKNKDLSRNAILMHVLNIKVA